jgi:dienelactone hydrolase
MRRSRRLPRVPRFVWPASAALIAVIAASVWYVNRQAGIRYAHEVLMPRIDSLMESTWSDFIDVHRLAVEAAAFIPDDPRLAQVIDRSTLRIDVDTEPRGASVYVKPYVAPEEEWELLGVTPIRDLQIPVGIFRWRIEKEGYEPVEVAETSWGVDVAGDTLVVPQNFFRRLDPVGSIPEGMVRVEGFTGADGIPMEDFFIDRFEVTNREFGAFVDAGGYGNRDLWRHEFRRDGVVLSWEEAMSAFVDATGRPGPSTWQAGLYPDGEDDLPVAGVSWYEAAAYAAWKGRDLPTERHWGRALGDGSPMIQFPQLGGFGTLAPFANFTSDGPVAVGSLGGYTTYGAYDMAGNVREWCWNETEHGRLIRGGAWDEMPYVFQNVSQEAPPMDRSVRTGFRLALYPDRGAVPPSFFAPTALPPAPDLSNVEPASDAEFAIYRTQFSYDDFPLAAVTEWRDDSAPSWIHERVSFDAAYSGERVLAHVFLPRNASPPYQAVIYFPGSAAQFQLSSEHIESYYEFTAFLSFLVRNGRAVVFPVYQGTFERTNPQQVGRLYRGLDLVAYTELNIERIKDLRRTIDYLETRDDIDADRLAYYGLSLGGQFGPVATAVEGRFRASVLVAAGVAARMRSTIWNYHYAPRVRVPTLILGGEFDTLIPAETAARPLFELLGTPAEDKKLILYPTDHIPPMNEVIRETLAWLDRHLGPVR